MDRSGTPGTGGPVYSTHRWEHGTPPGTGPGIRQISSLTAVHTRSPQTVGHTHAAQRASMLQATCREPTPESGSGCCPLGSRPPHPSPRCRCRAGLPHGCMTKHWRKRPAAGAALAAGAVLVTIGAGAFGAGTRTNASDSRTASAAGSTLARRARSGLGFATGGMAVHATR